MEMYSFQPIAFLHFMDYQIVALMIPYEVWFVQVWAMSQ